MGTKRKSVKTERARMAHQIVVFPGRYLNQASPPLGGAPARAYSGMITIYTIPNTIAAIPPTRNQCFCSRPPAASIAISSVFISDTPPVPAQRGVTSPEEVNPEEQPMATPESLFWIAGS